MTKPSRPAQSSIRPANDSAVGRGNEVFKRAQIFSFDGELLTVKQIHARVPALSLQTVRNHLKCGRMTSVAMLTFSTEAVRTANGKRAAKRYKSRTV